MSLLFWLSFRAELGTCCLPFFVRTTRDRRPELQGRGLDNNIRDAGRREDYLCSQEFIRPIGGHLAMQLERLSHYATIGSFVVGLVSLICSLFCAVVSGVLLWQSSKAPAVTATSASLPSIGGLSVLTPKAVLVGIFLVSLSVIAASILNFIATRRSRNSTSTIEQTIERYLMARGIAPDAPKETTPEVKTATADAVPPKLDGEIYRIVRSDKNPYSDLTRQLFEGAGKKFTIDIDILAEMYIVNTSSETQYIRDFLGSVEIDGVRRSLVREKDFLAFDVLDKHYEYCLDPNPEETSITLDARSEALTPLFANFPTSLEPKEAAEGWVRFLLGDTDPHKLEENRTYNFTLKDTLGTEYAISRAADPQRTTPQVKSRRRKA